MTPLADAVAELETCLPEAQARTHIPDTEATTGPRSKPGSKPPWNAAAEYAVTDAAEGIRRWEALWRSDVAKRPVPPRPISRTGETLASLLRLAEAAPPAEQRELGRQVTRWTVVILQFLGEVERPKVIDGHCPYCVARDESMRGRCQLVVLEHSGRVWCFFGRVVCADGDGNPPSGVIGQSVLDGSPRIFWDDGLVT